MEEPEDYRGQPKGDVLHYLLNKRLGAEVDYIIKGIDQESGIVAASRLEAMAMKRKEYYFRTDRDGNYQIYAGICAEARVVSVIRSTPWMVPVRIFLPFRDSTRSSRSLRSLTGRLNLAELQNRPRLTWNLRKALKARRTKALAPRLALNRRVMRLRMSPDLPPPRLTPGSPKAGSECLAGAASVWSPSTLSARWRRIRTSCAATCWT